MKKESKGLEPEEVKNETPEVKNETPEVENETPEVENEVTETKAVTPEKETKKQATRPEKNESVIYLGPSINGITNGTVFIGGKSAVLKGMIEQIPALNGLTVPLSGLVEAKKQLANPESALSTYYRIAMGKIEEMKKGGK